MDHHTIGMRIAQSARIIRGLLAFMVWVAMIGSAPNHTMASNAFRRMPLSASSQTIYLPLIATAWPFTPVIISYDAPRFIPQLTINGRFENLSRQTYDRFIIIVELVDARPQPLFDTITITATTALSYSLPGQRVYFGAIANWPISNPPPERKDFFVRARISEAQVTTATIFALTTVLTQSTNLGNAIGAYAEFRNDTPYVLTDTHVSFATLEQISGLDAIHIEGPIQPGQNVSATRAIAFAHQIAPLHPFFEVFAQGRATHAP